MITKLQVMSRYLTANIKIGLKDKGLNCEFN